MTRSIKRSKLLSQFSCLGERCGDTCCRVWSMQVDMPTMLRYEKDAPELLLDVGHDAGADTYVMRKDPKTGYCVKFDNGLCGIHKKYGDAFLGDACYFYPRVTRMLGDTVVMTASASCPEIARLAFAMPEGFGFDASQADRLPTTIKDYLPSEMTAEEALQVHRIFLQAAEDKETSAERIFARIASASRSLELIDKKNWPRAAEFYLKHADMRIPEPAYDVNDPFNLLIALAGLVIASQKTAGDRLQQTIANMEKALAAKVNWQTAQIETTDHSLLAYQKIRDAWKAYYAMHYDATLHRWLGMQLSFNLYPFAGLGHTLTERITMIGVRLATFKLALMCACATKGNVLTEEEIIHAGQSLSRFLDHLGDATFSLQIYQETGWVNEARMLGLLNG
jgi:lysine-N-methylase